MGFNIGMSVALSRDARALEQAIAASYGNAMLDVVDGSGLITFSDATLSARGRDWERVAMADWTPNLLVIAHAYDHEAIAWSQFLQAELVLALFLSENWGGANCCDIWEHGQLVRSWSEDEGARETRHPLEVELHFGDGAHGADYLDHLIVRLLGVGYNSLALGELVMRNYVCM